MENGKSRLHASHPLYGSTKLWLLHLDSLIPCRRVIARISDLAATWTPRARPYIPRISRVELRTSPHERIRGLGGGDKAHKEDQNLVEQVTNTLTQAEALGSTEANVKPARAHNNFDVRNNYM